MAKKVVVIDGRRDAYSVDQILNLCDTYTIGQLIEHLKTFDYDMPVMLINDNGYTYGSIDEYSFDVAESDEDEEDDDDDDYEDEEDDEDE